ncbi:tail fiber protein [Nocardioides sp. LMS-CY]|uniref:phage tail protein n=1 Tax=Nocardioides sp. (strain LMS-CY) TaxID=2840457 RepID=UPI001C0018C6|nr:tail fiber protein [Nocardioides sp. LMS-CY]QWF21824.1 tail fiber protein [Nocardioides sp. LMS-CY]
MAEPFLAEIRLMSFEFAPKGWALCNGQLLPINQNQALFSLLGTTFGGDGRTNFALPDYRGRTPIHVGAGHTLGERGGEVGHILSMGELPAHTHRVRASNHAVPGATAPDGRYLGRANNAYTAGPPSTTLRPDTVTAVGGSQAHLNLQPFLTISFCIALQGIFPSPT